MRTGNVARTVGRYEILEELGRGGMATVFLARQSDLDRLVALKELSAFRQSDRSFTQRFLRESRLAASLSHPNIVTVHDYFESGGIPYIAMEYVAGGSLRPHIGHVSLTQVAGVLEGILSALDHAERHHIVHRDLKPENVMVTSEGSVKITDFGIAKATGKAQMDSVLTAAGSTVGTPNYMAPEQAMGQDVGPWTDLYSVGVMAFELFVGQVPFHDTEEPMAVLMRQVSDPIPPASSLNPEVDRAISDWIERLLVKNPEERTQAAGEALDQFEEIVIALVGPRWRRSARLLPPSRRPADAPAGPATPPPSAAARPPLMPSWEIPSRPPGERPTISEAPTRRLRDEEEEAFAATVMPDAPTLPLDDDDESSERPRKRRFGALLKGAVVLVAVLAVLAAAFGGRGSPPGGSSSSPPGGPVAAPVSSVAGPAMALQVPRGWRRLHTAPDVGLPLSGAVAAAPRRRGAGPVVEFGVMRGDTAANSALLPAAFLSSIGQQAGSVPTRKLVLLPTQHLEAWRYAGQRPLGTESELTLYTVPTSAGVATVACAVPPGQGRAFAGQCEAIAGTVRLRRGRPYPIGASDTYASALNETMGALQGATRSNEASLQAAQTLTTQAAAAVALASSYEDAAAQLAALDLSPADRGANGRLVRALRGAAAAYRRAAQAATAGDASAYRDASAAIPTAKAQVNAALAGLNAAGYKPAREAAPPSSSAPGPASTKPAPPASDVGDSRSDDPSDDSADP
jgi:serine/threonine protein kinase